MKQKRKANKFFIIVLISIGVLVLILGMYQLPSQYNIPAARKFLSGIENSSLNWRFISKAFQSGSLAIGGKLTFRKNVAGIYTNMLVISVDNESILYYNTYPLDRNVWAKMLDYYNSLKDIPRQRSYAPSLMLFDIFFDKPSPRKESDKALIQSLKKYKRIVGDDFMLYDIQGLNLNKNIQSQEIKGKNRQIVLDEGLSYNSPEAAALRKFELNIKGDLGQLKPYFKIKSIMKEISENLTFAGAVNIEPNEPGEEIYRKNPLILSMKYYTEDNGTIKLTNVYYPSVILATAVKLLNADISNIILNKGLITIKNALYKNERIDFKIPVDNEYRLSINYKANPSSGYIKIIPVKYALNMGVPKNSIFLIGVIIPGATDNKWLSPMGSMYSVEHLGYSLGTIMNRDFIIEIPLWMNISYTILFTLLIGLLLSSGTRATIAALILSIIFPIILSFALFQFNIQIITLIPIITSIMVLILGEVYILLTEETEKRFIKSTFSKYVSPDLVNILVKNPEMLQLGGQDKEATVLFSDIRGFTTLSEGMAPKELISFLNIYLTKMTDIIMETKGTLDKYIGDAVVAFWGTPIDLEDHALKACQAGIKMIEALKVFNEEQTKLGYKPINIGIGLNTGSITVGNIGSEKKRNYTAIGDNMNLAEDLQDENKFYETNIIISQFTYEKVKEWAITRELDTIYIKGGKEPIKIYELLDITKWD